MRPRTLPTAAGLLAALVAGVIVGSSSCAASPPNSPIRSFEGAQKVAVVCLRVNDTLGIPLDETLPPFGPVPQGECAPVPSFTNGATLANHLFALVTQTVRGEVAVVDLTGGGIVDEDRSTPGINFIPVGSNPTDVVVAPDAMLTFVSTASRIPAIYTIPNSRILGDTINTAAAPLLLTSLTACSLPEPPLALGIVPLPAPSTDGGAAEGGSADGGTSGDAGDAGDAAPAAAPVSYAIVAVLGGSAGGTVVTINPNLSGLIGGTPGSLPACSISGTVALSSSLPPSWAPGPPWPDGVPYTDAGSVTDAQPPQGPACIGTPVFVGPQEDGGAEAGLVVEGPEAGTDAGSTGASFPLSFGPLNPPSPRGMVMRSDVPLAYVADDTIPVIHVIDFSVPSAPHELEPLLATSLAQPSRQVHVGGLAISPPTREYLIYLYAIDSSDGSLMIYDVTDPVTSPHLPQIRPHPELNPFEPVDRISFSSPVAAVAFIQHDWVVPANVANPNLAYPVNAYTGLLCNPNQNAHPNALTFNDFGAYYRVDQAPQIQPQATALNFPNRLRGIFAFATLSNGTIAAIDVDDWDAPCRRPDPMAVGQLPGVFDGGAITGVLDIPQQAPVSPTDLDPYHAPETYSQDPSLAESPAVTLESFFPVSAPHRVRSSVLLRNDPTAGNHAPNLVGTPTLVDMNGSPVSPTTASAVVMGSTTFSPVLLPTTLPPGWIDPTTLSNPTEPDPANVSTLPVTGTLGSAGDPAVAGVRLSFDDPTATQNQDWTVTYEGVLPTSTSDPQTGARGIVADVTSTIPAGLPGAYTTLTFTTSGTNLCSVGIEDWTIGQARAAQVLAAVKTQKLPVPPQFLQLASWTTDYILLSDDIPTQDDPYWTVNAPPAGAEPDGEGQIDDCWAGTGYDTPSDPNDPAAVAAVANQRYNACLQTFGWAANANTTYSRDLPILNAYADHLVVGRFGWPEGVAEATTNRYVVPNDPVGSPPRLKLVSCCFHRQPAFEVRTGGEWLAAGQGGLGVLSHVVTDPSTGACVLSCDPNDVLLNARSFDIPWGTPSTSPGSNCVLPPGMGVAPAIDRNSVLAMRNPMFSYVTWSGCGQLPTTTGDHTLTARDLTWRFSVRGGFSPLTISLSGASPGSTSPQSMLFIDSLGQLAVVDGAQQGLVLIDLSAVTFAHAPYF
jgi:hypothetical protein